MKIVALVQARMGSTRLPGKVLKPIVNKPMIELLLTRLSQSNELNEIVVAASEEAQMISYNRWLSLWVINVQEAVKRMY